MTNDTAPPRATPSPVRTTDLNAVEPDPSDARSEWRSPEALVRLASRWARFAAERVRPGSLDPFEKALGALAFALASRSRSLAIPTKLIGVRACQTAIRALAASGAPFGFRLEMRAAPGEDGEPHIEVSVGLPGQPVRVLGHVQQKHLPWMNPLLPLGLECRLIRVTGDAARGHTHGVNVAVTGIDEALRRHADADGSR